ncbi:MAG TPA: hypothetical protein VFB21_13340, partial [Chthonomonadaceae bacterium]|nr:hypothetical protein [Chthonomonadaceae bacterium]
MAADSADLLVARATQELEAAGVESSRLEAQLLLALALGVSRTTILAGLAPEPDERQRAEFARLVRARARRVPLAYLRGTQEFYGLTFAVSPAVLIPRPETELLVEFALEKLGETHPPSPSPQGRGSKPDASALQPDLEETERLAHPLPSPLQGEGQGVRVEANR